jgi:hypothetical protein
MFFRVAIDKYGLIFQIKQCVERNSFASESVWFNHISEQLTVRDCEIAHCEERVGQAFHGGPLLNSCDNNLNS